MALATQPSTPFEAIDRALYVVRRGGGALLGRALGGGAIFGVVAIAVFYVERVENVHSLRPLSAMALVAAFYARSILMARAAHLATRAIDEDLATPGATWLDVVRTATVFGLGLAMWSLPFVLASKVGWVMVALLVPALALRGVIAPSWLARSGCATGGGLRAALASLGDTGARRTLSLLVELFVLIGAFGLAIDLFALFYALALLSRTFLALDATFVESFLALDNTFMLVVLGVLVFVVLEPLRAAISANAYVDARIREEGIDLRAAIDDAIEAAEKRGAFRGDSTRAPGIAAALALMVLASASGARAQEDPDQSIYFSQDGITIGDPIVAALPPARFDAYDEQVLSRTERILASSDFVEADESGNGFRELFARFLRWLLEQREPPVAPRGVAIPMPTTSIFIVIAIALAVVALGMVAMKFASGKRAPKAAAGGEEAPSSPIEIAPERHLDDASRLAKASDYRLALRALYLATLVALDRRRAITYDDAKTNWQYLRELRYAGARQPFADFTRIFDRVWYGDEAATENDYQSARHLAEEIVGPRESLEPSP